MKEEHIFINCYNSKLNLCFSLKKLVSNYSLDILCVLEFATNRNAPKPSAGVPLTYWLDNGVVTSIENISSNFLKTPFTVNDWGTYRKNGFLPNITLTEIFSNKYTNVNAGKPQVRSMNADDILKVIAKANNNMNNVSRDEIIKKVYNNLFYIGGDYFLATAYTSAANNLWRINSIGNPGNATPASCLGIRPVVSLNNTVRARTVDMIGAWNIEI